MRSSIYVNELRPGHVVLDFSNSPHMLLDEEIAYGFVYLKTLDHLGVERTINENGSTFKSLHASGSVEAMKEHIQDLHRHIGLIARYGAQKLYAAPWDRDLFGRTLGHLCDRAIPDMTRETTFAQAMGIVTHPFAEMTNDDGVVIYFDEVAPWRYETIATEEKP